MNHFNNWWVSGTWYALWFNALMVLAFYGINDWIYKRVRRARRK